MAPKKFTPTISLSTTKIVNDDINGTKISATFCPLCGSGIVFNREIDGRQLEFGVSGFLRESNMIMYDRQTESLWQQSTGESFAGELNEKQLELTPFQLLTVGEIRDKFPGSLIMTTNTGHNRDYTSSPYGNYDNNDSFIFNPSNLDERFPAKERFYIVPVGDKSVAIRISELNGSAEYNENDISLRAENSDGRDKSLWW